MNVTLRRGKSIPNPFPHPNPGGNGGVVSGRGVVEMIHTNVQATSNPIWITDGAARVSDSEFADGAGTAIFAPAIELADVAVAQRREPVRRHGNETFAVIIDDDRHVLAGSDNHNFFRRREVKVQAT